MSRSKLIANYYGMATFILFMIWFAAQAQQPTLLPAGSLVEPSDSIFRQATNSPGYLVVKKIDWDRLKQVWRDSLNQTNKSLEEEKGKYLEKIDSISRLTESQASKSDLPSSSNVKTSSDLPNRTLLLFGFGISLLIIYSLFITYRLFSQIGVFKSQHDRLDQIEKDFDQHKKNAIERERKLMRELIDTQNHLSEEKSKQKPD